MLTNTFCHIPGIGPKIEQNLWSAGILSWHSACPPGDMELPRCLRESWSRHLQESMEHHSNRNPTYFVSNLPARQHWRLYGDFQDSCAFLDIETTGLSSVAEITTIALYDGRRIRYFVNGTNLGDFPAAVREYQLLVTYNGKLFDLPFIERCFGIRLPQAHIDLMFPLRSLGLKGGLKGCERQVGIQRPGLEHVDGFVAVLLWEEYRRHKNLKALQTLLAYNLHDAVNLHALMVHAYNEKLKATPFADSHSLPVPVRPDLPFEADPEMLQRVRHQGFGSWSSASRRGSG